MTSLKRTGTALLVLAALSYTLMLAAASLLPVSSSSPLAATATRRLINNLLHLPAYAVLAWLWTAQFRAVTGRSGRNRVMLAACFAAVGFGTCMELAQSLIPGRKASLGDFVLNASGVGVAALLMWVRARRTQAKKGRTDEARGSVETAE